MMQDHYKILEISADASEEEITKAYRRKLRTWHPDLWPQHRKAYATAHFKKIILAYEVLSHPEQRAAFDREHAARMPAPVRLEPFICPKCGGVTAVDKARRLEGKQYCDLCFWKLVYERRDQNQADNRR